MDFFLIKLAFSKRNKPISIEVMELNSIFCKMMKYKAGKVENETFAGNRTANQRAVFKTDSERCQHPGVHGQSQPFCIVTALKTNPPRKCSLF